MRLEWVAPMMAKSKLMTADDLLRQSDDGLGHGLVRGELRTMAPTGWEHGREPSVLDARRIPRSR